MSKNPAWEAEQAQFDRESLEQLTEQEREGYERFLPILEGLRHNEVNNDRRHRRKQQIGYEDQLEQWLSEESTVQRRRGAPPDFKGPDYLTLIEKDECLRQGKPYYANKVLEEIIGMLTAPQRDALELTEMWGYSTKEVAAMQGTSERNVRKLRQRAMDNIRDIYAETLGNKRYLSLRQKQFLERISAD